MSGTTGKHEDVKVLKCHFCGENDINKLAISPIASENFEERAVCWGCLASKIIDDEKLCKCGGIVEEVLVDDEVATICPDCKRRWS